MSVWRWITGREGAAERVQPVRAPSFEPLEPRLLLDANLTDAQPLSCPVVTLDNQAIVIDLNREGAGSQESDSCVIAMLPMSCGQASLAEQPDSSSQSEVSDLGPVGQDDATDSETDPTVDINLRTAGGSVVALDGAASEVLSDTPEGCADRCNCGDEPVTVQAPADAAPRGPPVTGETTISQIIFVHSALDSSFQLKNARLPGVAVSVLDTGRDGVQQITDILWGYRNLSAIHIISHGAPGRVILGTATLSLSSLNEYADDLAAWGESLSEGGDILLCGCGIGARQEGEALIQGLAGLTGADVAASSDPTGPAELGGDWVLETATGPIEASRPNPETVVVIHGLLAAGDLDTTFGSGGKVVTPVGPWSDYGHGVAIQSDGKIIVAGYTDDDFAVVRYNSDGSLDASFGGTGKITTSLASSSDHANCVVVQSDGKIVLGGVSAGNFALVRHGPSGALDTSFSGDGIVTTSISSSNDIVNSMALQPDGKILVAGTSGSHIGVARYSPDGTLDTSFSGDGIQTMSYGITDRIWGMALQPDGKIVLVGDCWNGEQWDFLVVRYNPDGTLDTSFSGDGKLATPVGPSHDNGRSVAIQSDGRIVVAGYSYSAGGAGNADFAVVRYNPDGTLDTTFSGDGKLTTAIGSADDIAYSMVLQSEGKIVVAGYSDNGANEDFALVRYNPDGTLDLSFSGDGKLTTAVGSAEDYINGVAIQPDGKIVVAGYSWSGTNDDFALARYEGVSPVVPLSMAVLGNDITITNGDSTPSVSDGTDFGEVTQGGATVSHTFRVANTGSQTLTPGAVAVPTGFTLTDGLSPTLAPGASDTFTIRLDVVTLGTKTGYVSFANNTSQNPFTFAITGTTIPVVEPEITVLGYSMSIANEDTTPDYADNTQFTDIPQGMTPYNCVYTVRNDGTAPLTLGTIRVPTGFTLAEGLPASLAPGASDTFTIRLETAVVGAKIGDVSIENNDRNESPFVFRIAVNVIAAVDFHVLCNGIEIVDGDTTPDPADGTDFGTVIQGGLPAVQTFVIRARWDAVPASLPVTVPGGFTLGPVYDWPEEGFGTGTHIFWVQLDTSVPGIKSGEISFPTLIPGQNPFNFRVTGEVVEPSALAPAEQFTGWADSFDLANKAIMLTPRGSGYGFSVRTISSLPTSVAGATNLSLEDDDSVAVSLGSGQSVLLYGQSYSSFYVGSNGYLTFTQADSDASDTWADHFDTPRVSVLFDNLNPAAGGQVSWQQLSDRVVVTWNGVIEQDAGGANTIQVEMYFDGRIQLAWLGVTSLDGVVGLSDGLGVPDGFVETNFFLAVPKITVLGHGFPIGNGDTTLSTIDHTDFGTAVRDDYEFIIRNDGNAVLTLGSVTAPDGFRAGAVENNSLWPGVWTTFTIGLGTGTPGVKTGDVSIVTNDPEANPFHFTVTGTVPPPMPEAVVLGNGISIAAGDTSPSTSDGTDFGSTEQRGDTVNRVFTVYNDGGSTLTLGAVTVPAGFLLMKALPSSLAPQTSATFIVQLDSTVAGTKTGDVSFATNDYDENPFNFRITGMVVGAGNLALGRPATASTSFPGLPASNATDGNAASRWSSQYSDSEWISVDLGLAYTINRVALRWESAYGRGYKLQVSNDASAWSDVYSTTAGDGGVDDITLTTPASGRYLRMLGTQRVTEYGYSLFELEVYGNVTGPEIAVSGNGVSITDGDATASAGDGTDFGSVAQGGGSRQSHVHGPQRRERSADAGSGDGAGGLYADGGVGEQSGRRDLGYVHGAVGYGHPGNQERRNHFLEQ